jgi:hypothetical protein
VTLENSTSDIKKADEGEQIITDRHKCVVKLIMVAAPLGELGVGILYQVFLSNGKTR